jgi:hypothetical protein
MHAPGAAGAAAQPAGVPSASGVSAVDLAMLSAGGRLTAGGHYAAGMDTAGAVRAQESMVVLVLDTNVLLKRSCCVSCTRCSSCSSSNKSWRDQAAPGAGAAAVAWQQLGGQQGPSSSAGAGGGAMDCPGAVG